MNGCLPPSKSEWIRAALLKSYEPSIQIDYTGKSAVLCDDIRQAQAAFENLVNNLPADAGGSATAFRFAVLRASRMKGIHRISGKPSLLSRPQQPLLDFLKNVGVRATVTGATWEVESSGWKTLSPSTSIPVDSSHSSQFASAVLLNSIDLESDLKVSVSENMVSKSYFRLTLDMLEQAGIKWTQSGSEFVIAAHQKLKPVTFTIEPDFSCAFAIAAFATLNGQTYSAPTRTSRQPDACFADIFEKMRATTGRMELKAINQNLTDTPDLFPVLAVLCAFADGESVLSGAPHLAFKESNRIEKISELFTKANIKFERRPDGLRIFGGTRAKINCTPFVFDPADDHRMVMAAALLKSQGCPVTILNPDCVNKSFPDFWKMVG